jgi:hypothetical protein
MIGLIMPWRKDTIGEQDGCRERVHILLPLGISIYDEYLRYLKR